MSKLLTIVRQFTSTSCQNNVYANFVRSKFHEVKSTKPELTNIEVLKQLSVLYKSLPAKELEKLKTETKEEQSEIVKATRFAYRNGMPKPPPNSGLKIFIREKLNNCKGTSLSKMRDDFKTTIKQWLSLPQSKQLEYNNMAKELRKNYEVSLKEWAVDNNLRYTKRVSLLANRFYKLNKAPSKS
ncbi:unnamed protein product [Trichobilharzia szidati]|nr:unnamed protein product [Trichobilharzia szidati]